MENLKKSKRRKNKNTDQGKEGARDSCVCVVWCGGVKEPLTKGSNLKCTNLTLTCGGGAVAEKEFSAFPLES